MVTDTLIESGVTGCSIQNHDSVKWSFTCLVLTNILMQIFRKVYFETILLYYLYHAVSHKGFLNAGFAMAYVDLEKSSSLDVENPINKLNQVKVNFKRCLKI